MTTATARERYSALLAAYFASPDEKYLLEAADLGRELVRADVPPEEIAELHAEAVCRLADQSPQATLMQAGASLSQPLMELLIAYGLAFRERQQRLRASEANYRAIFNATNDAIIVLDADSGAVLDANHRTCEMFGQRREEILGGTFVELVAGAEQTSIEDLAARVRRAASGQPQLFEWAARDGDGRGFWVEVNLKRAVIGETRCVLAVVRDITSRKQAEEARRKLETRMQQAQKLQSLGLLAGGAAHDFNTLLTVILGYADLALRDAGADSPVCPPLREIKKAAERAAELTRQLLAYSGRGHLAAQRLDLNALIEEMAHLLKVSISKVAALEFDFAADLPAIEADPGQIRQVVMNLITNASEAIGEAGGTIRIATGVVDADRAYLSESYLDEALPEGRYVYLEVSDTGCGMDEQARERIFDPFYTTKFTGRGLGLAAVLGIVRSHGGAIKVHSQPGKGSTFRVLLPCPTGTYRPAGQGAESHSGQAGGTILVVDDEESIRELAERLLRSAGFTVLTAANGAEAVSIFRQHAEEIAAVLLDMTMPGMDGQATFQELRKVRPDVRVILSSGYSEGDAASRFAGKGLAGFIQKPYTYETLMAKLTRVLSPA